MLNSKIHLKKGDRVILKSIFKYPVPTATELKLLLDYFDKRPHIQLALAFIFIQGLRPVEVPRLTWSCFELSADKTKVISMRHLVYKPMNRKTHTGTNYYFKEVKKPIYSKWLSDLILTYSKTAPKYDNNMIFAFRHPDSIQKELLKLRNKAKKGLLPERYSFILDKSAKVVIGVNITKYRINLYALRRFAFTFHYYTTFNQDSVALSKTFGHERTETTMTHYVQPKEAVELTDEMINKEIDIDEFVILKPKNQLILNDWIVKDNKFLEYGQKTLKQY